LNIEIRCLSKNDLPSVALIHVAAFPKSALTKLGVEAVRRYYEWQLIGPHECNALGAFFDDRLVGFCFAGVFKGAISGFLQKNWLFLLRCVLVRPWLLMNPIFRERTSMTLRILRRLLRQRFGMKRETFSLLKQNPLKSYIILSIAVDPRYQGLGIGKMLMKCAEAIAKEKGFCEMDLIVDPQNERAIRFYERLGWEKVVNENGWAGRMRKRLK